MKKLQYIEIDIMINNKDDIIDKFNKNKLSSELSQYIYRQCFGTPLKKHVTLNIICKDNLSIEDQNNIIDVIRSNYGNLISENLIYLKHDRSKTLILFIIGILLLTTSKLIKEFIISEILLIIGWLSIWEATYNFIFDDNKKRVKIKRYKKLTKCKINFI